MEQSEIVKDCKANSEYHDCFVEDEESNSDLEARLYETIHFDSSSIIPESSSNNLNSSPNSENNSGRKRKKVTESQALVLNQQSIGNCTSRSAKKGHVVVENHDDVIENHTNPITKKAKVSYSTSIIKNPYSKEIYSKKNATCNNSRIGLSKSKSKTKSVNPLASVIELSSDSSQDSTEISNPKYDVIETQKKLNNTQNFQEDKDSESDSNESIFEVPVPPKPTPLIIELRDSENEDDIYESLTDSDNDNTNVVHKIHDNEDLNLSITINTTLQSTSEVEPQNSARSISPRLQKTASTIKQIKKMSQNANMHTICDQQVQKQQTDENLKNDNVLKDHCNENLVDKEDTITTRNRRTMMPYCQTRNSRTMSDKDYFFEPMSHKMIAFYNDSWGGENFSLETLQRQMTKNPEKWAILTDDMRANVSKRKRYFSAICRRCNQEGHRQNECKEYKGPCCYMCGENGHIEASCPYKQCLTCGQKQTMYRKTCNRCKNLRCNRCNSRGHSRDSCPDLWRRYHHSTSPVDAQIPCNPFQVMKPYHTLSCCNCTKTGHDSKNCPKLRFSQHYPNPSNVTDYFGTPLITKIISKQINFNDITSNEVNSSYPDNITSVERDRNKNLDESSINQMSSSKKERYFVCKSNSNILANRIIEPLSKIRLSDEVRNKSCNWKKLTDFLRRTVQEDPSEFRLTKDACGFIELKMRALKDVKENYIKVIEQFLQRTDIERIRMHFPKSRVVKDILKTLNNGLKNLKDSSSDPLLIHNKILELNQINNEKNSTCSSPLMDYETELMMLLYKNNCGPDASLLTLENIKKSLAALNPNSKMSFKTFLNFIYCYNSVFTPHLPKNLQELLSKYKEYKAISSSTNIQNIENSNNTMRDGSNSAVFVDDIGNHIPQHNNYISKSKVFKHSNECLANVSTDTNNSGYISPDCNNVILSTANDLGGETSKLAEKKKMFEDEFRGVVVQTNQELYNLINNNEKKKAIRK